MSSRRLDLWLYGTHVMTLSSRRPGGVRGEFTADALDRWGFNSKVLSVSLPLDYGKANPESLTRFLDNLLPEGDLREKLARSRRLLSGDVFGLLGEYGRDTAGAVTVLPEGERPGDEEYAYEPLDENGVALALEAAARRPLGIRDLEDHRSLGGVREKVLLARRDGRWFRPLGSSPSTHILKPPRGERSRTSSSTSPSVSRSSARPVPAPRRRGSRSSRGSLHSSSSATTATSLTVGS